MTLTYDFRNCFYSAAPSATAEENYAIAMDGVVSGQGTLDRQPTSTTALTVLA